MTLSELHFGHLISIFYIPLQIVSFLPTDYTQGKQRSPAAAAAFVVDSYHVFFYILGFYYEFHPAGVALGTEKSYAPPGLHANG